MPWNDSTGPVPHRTEAELLALVRHKATASDAAQRRRQAAVAGAAAVLMIVGLATVVVRRGPEPATQLLTTGEGPTSTVSDPPPTSAVASSTTVQVAVTVPRTTRPTAAPTTRTTRPPATTTTIVCRDSSDPVCGPFRWDPPLGANRPLTATVTYVPANPRAGEAVTFRVVVDDPDGSMLLDTTGIANSYGDVPPEPAPNAHVDCLEAYGPWTPPAPRPVHAELSFQHTYANPGTYVATLPFKAIGDCTYGPSEATATVTVTVAP